MYLWETSFGYARRRCVEYFTRLECFAAPIHRLFSLTRSRIHRNVCSPAVVTKFWMCKEVCSFCPRALFKRIDITSIEIYMAFNHRTIHDEQHVSIYIDYFFNSLFERSRKNIVNEIRLWTLGCKVTGKKAWILKREFQKKSNFKKYHINI